MSTPSSPDRSVVALVSTSDPEWQPILHSSNQVVLYNPRSHALTISQSSNFPSAATSVVAARKPRPCPYCKQTIPPSLDHDLFEAHGELEHETDNDNDNDDGLESIYTDDPAYHSRAADYFQLLAISNEMSRPASPTHALFEDGYSTTPQTSTFPAENMAEGYFNRFFQEEYKLGMGANGSVFLCQHVLDGNPLGHFAVKKIAVGESHSYLLKILREVRLLEQLHHPNIVTYHHAWLETSQFSAFGPRVPTLHVLMQWAEGGSLDDFIDMRLGRKTAHPHIHFVPNEGVGRLDTNDRTPTSSPGPESMQSRSARIRAFRVFQHATPEERERMMKEGYGRPDGPERRKSGKEWTPVHLLSADEVKSLFHDVVEGLGFLHNKSILHLDLKPGNVLLTWDDGRMIPRAMLSDFGTSRDMINSGRDQRSGNTGTLEYTSPESLPSPETGLLGQIDSKSDMWSLGMILYKMLFFKLPYRYAAEGDANGEPTSIDRSQEDEKMARLEREVFQYPGFKGSPSLVANFEARRLPRSYLVLLESLLHRTPAGRPSCERVKTAIREGKFDPLRSSPIGNGNETRASPDALVTLDRHLRARSRSQSRSTDSEALNGRRHHHFHGSGSEQQSQPKLLSLLPSPPPSASLSSPLSEGTTGPKSSGKSSSRRASGSSSSGGGVNASGPFGWAMNAWDKKQSQIEKNPTWKTIGRAMKSRKGRLTLKIIRSLILVSKVLSTPRLCRSVEEHPRPAALAILLGAAVADTILDVEPWYRGVLVSFGLAMFHVKVMEYGAGTGVCCSR